MATEYNALVFKCLLLDSKKKPITNFNYGIQIFNNQLNSWQNVDKPILSEKGELLYTYKIPSRISTSDTQRRAIREVLQASCIPQFRLIRWDKEQVFIISNTPTVIANLKTLAITLDFNICYLLDTDKHYDTINGVVIAQSERHYILQQQLTDTSAELKNIKDSFNTENAQAQETITALNENLKLIEAEKTNLETQLNTLKEALENGKNSDEELAVLHEKIEELNTTIEQLKNEYNYLKDLLVSEQGKTEALEGTVTNLNIKLKNSITEVAEKQKSITELSQVLETKNKEIDTLNTKIEELNTYSTADNPNKLEAQKVYSSIVNDIVTADSQMDNSRFKLANISMNLKATVEKGPTGTMLGLIDFDSAQNINGAAISDISIDIVPNSNTVVAKDTVPNILGLTESAVRNILVNYGLKLDVVYQPTDNPKLIEGQSFKTISSGWLRLNKRTRHHRNILETITIKQKHYAK